MQTFSTACNDTYNVFFKLFFKLNLKTKIKHACYLKEMKLFRHQPVQLLIG
jgi:hypothetical protein